MKVQVLNGRYNGSRVTVSSQTIHRDMPEIEKKTKSAIDNSTGFGMFGGEIHVGDRIYSVLPIID